MQTNKERRDATRHLIISNARECFTKDGYDATRTDTILELAGISRGAMYHHFPSKRDVFEAVYLCVVEESISHALRAGTNKGSPLDDLLASCNAWLRLVRKPQVATILIEQGPQVLGWKRAREIEESLSLAPMQASIARACDAGDIEVPSVEIAALLINALLAEMAQIAIHRKPKISIAMQEASIRRFIHGLGPNARLKKS